MEHSETREAVQNTLTSHTYDINCDGRFQSTEQVKAINEYLQRIAQIALVDSKLDSRELTYIEQMNFSDQKKFFASRPPLPEVFPNGIESLSDDQIHSIVNTAHELARDTKSKIQNVTTLGHARASLGMAMMDAKSELSGLVAVAAATAADLNFPFTHQCNRSPKLPNNGQER